MDRGLLGVGTYADLYQCSFKGEVSGWNYVGGLIGNSSGPNTIKQCFSKGSVKGNAAVGGFFGHTNYLNESVKDSYSTALLTSSDDAVPSNCIKYLSTDQLTIFVYHNILNIY